MGHTDMLEGQPVSFKCLGEVVEVEEINPASPIDNLLFVCGSESCSLSPLNGEPIATDSRGVEMQMDWGCEVWRADPNYKPGGEVPERLIPHEIRAIIES